MYSSTRFNCIGRAIHVLFVQSLQWLTLLVITPQVLTIMTQRQQWKWHQDNDDDVLTSTAKWPLPVQFFRASFRFPAVLQPRIFCARSYLLLNCSRNRIIRPFHHCAAVRLQRSCLASFCPARRHLVSPPVIDGRPDRVRRCWRRLRRSSWSRQEGHTGRKRNASRTLGIHYLLAKREGMSSDATPHHAKPRTPRTMRDQ